MAAKKTPIKFNDMNELKHILEKIPEERKPIADKLYNELEFMYFTLVNLRERVNTDGAIIETDRGTLKENPALKAYNTTIQRYSLLYKQVADLMPKVSEQKEIDPLIDFINKV